MFIQVYMKLKKFLQVSAIHSLYLAILIYISLVYKFDHFLNIVYHGQLIRRTAIRASSRIGRGAGPGRS